MDRAAGPSHRLPVFHDFFQGEGYEHEWVDGARFPKCRVSALAWRVAYAKKRLCSVVVSSMPA